MGKRSRERSLEFDGASRGLTSGFTKLALDVRIEPWRWVVPSVRRGSSQRTLHPQPDRHHAQVGLHTLAMGRAGCLEDLVHRRLFISDQAHLSHVQVGQRPSVLEGGAGLSAATGAA